MPTLRVNHLLASFFIFILCFAFSSLFNLSFAQHNPRHFGIRLGIGAVGDGDLQSGSAYREINPAGNITGFYSHQWQTSRIGFQIELGIKGVYMLRNPEFKGFFFHYFLGQTELGTYFKLRLNNSAAKYYLHFGPKIESLALFMGKELTSLRLNEEFRVYTQFSSEPFHRLNNYTFFYGGHLSFWRELPHINFGIVQTLVGVGLEYTRPAQSEILIPFPDGIIYPFASFAFGF